MTATPAHTAAALSLPVLALGVPIFDTLLSMLRRFLGRRSLFAADRGHIHHRLLERGLGHRQTVLALYSLSLAAAVVGAVMVLLARLSRIASREAVVATQESSHPVRFIRRRDHALTAQRARFA